MSINKLRRISLRNKGFSLVELIIVIAIMAILIAVLAPMFIRYVERTRQTRDISAIGEMSNALKAAAMDTTIALSPPDELEIRWDCGAGGSVTVDDPRYQPSIDATLGTADIPAVSIAARNTPLAEVIITLDTTSGLISAVGTNITDPDFLGLLAQVR